MDWLQQLAALGPALGSVAVIGVICWRLLQLFDRLMDKIEGASMKINSTLSDLSKNVEKNTEVTSRMSLIIEKQYDYVPRTGHHSQRAG